jgi:peptidoglycan-N-acetylglucosamine deacetylase
MNPRRQGNCCLGGKPTWMKILPLLLVASLFLVCRPALAEPTATWDSFLREAPRNSKEADQMSLTLNQLYLAELNQLDRSPIRWWVQQSRQHCQQNIKNAQVRLGNTSVASTPEWTRSAKRFLSDYAAEQAKLARLYPKYSSEVYLQTNEQAGWELADGNFRLTFDDGPKPINTQHVIESLRSAHLPATFFLVGKRIQEGHSSGNMPNYQGFTLGNHSYDHSNLSTLTQDQVHWQLQKTQDAAQAIGTPLSKQFRAPYGSRGPRELKVADRLGLQSVLWNVDSQDWQDSMQSQSGRIASRTLALMLLNRRGIVLMHDIHAQTGRELDRLIPILKAIGYHIVD